jgi:hypothetical protein
MYTSGGMNCCFSFGDTFLKIANGIIGDVTKTIVDEFEFVFSDLNCSENS